MINRDFRRLKELSDVFEDCYRADAGEIDWALENGYVEASILESGDLDDMVIDAGDFEIGELYYQFSQKGLNLLNSSEKDIQ